MSNEHHVSFEFRDGEWMTGGKPAKSHKLTFGEKSGPHVIQFRVGHPTGRFRFVESDPIWVKDDDGECPAEPSSNADIKVKTCVPTMLMIENSNEKAANLRYQLNVFDDHDKVHRPIDPIMTNGGNGRS